MAMPAAMRSPRERAAGEGGAGGREELAGGMVMVRDEAPTFTLGSVAGAAAGSGVAEDHGSRVVRGDVNHHQTAATNSAPAPKAMAL